MKKPDAARLKKHLWAAFHISPPGTTLRAEIDAALKEISKYDDLEVCPECRQMLRSWRDHDRDCTVQ